MNYNRKLNFRGFIINENNDFLKEKAGEIYSDLQDIQSTIKQIGVDSLANDIKVTVNKIRAIVGGHWLKQQMGFLETLQKVGVALIKSVEENDNVEEIVNASVDKIKTDIMDKIAGPINNLGKNAKDAPASPQNTIQKSPTEPDIKAQAPISGFDSSKNPPVGQAPEGTMRS